MLDCLEKIDKKVTGVFAAGILFGTAGVKILSSKDAKKRIHISLRLCCAQRNM